MSDSKNIKIARIIGMADDEYVAEAEPKMKIKKPPLRTVKKVLITAACIAAAALMAVAALRKGPEHPYEGNLPFEESSEAFTEDSTPVTEVIDIGEKYADSEYYDTIMAIENCNGNNQISTGSISIADSSSSKVPDKYIEVTDNQVAGITEPDLVKRTEKYIFSLVSGKRSSGGKYLTLYVYDISSRSDLPVATKTINPMNEGDYDLQWSVLSTPQLFLSDDGSILTIMDTLSGNPKSDPDNYREAIYETAVISLDISDPKNITVRGAVKVSGFFVAARKTGKRIVLFTARNLSRINYDAPHTYLPFIDNGGKLEIFSQDDIILPDEVTDECYTAITLIDEKSVEIKGMKAYYSYLGDPYVTEDKIFLSYSYLNDQGEEKKEAVTDILVIIYGNSYLNKYSTFTVTGLIKDRYAMDYYKGILRVVTTTGVKSRSVLSTGATWSDPKEINVNLYCIDIEQLKIAGKVIGFAPDGEMASAVRYEENMAYVCTAEVVTATDPVYFFDLSDPTNITYTDTGIIEGYSTSLIELGDGYLMGVGRGDKSGLKIEVYKEMGDMVVPISTYSYEKCSYSKSYMSYFVDRENGYIGLCVNDYGVYGVPQNKYLLIKFDGDKLVELQNVRLDDNASPTLTRAFIDDGYLYIISQQYFKVVSMK